ncbi:hypothetical protein IMZ31_22525 (plasmid) [Pontibacillus sp. ALD_SL1]|uniref:hypothetical protein n=1 Tax=Pontibacillus sp. ALD_SL1 TaxID=2777185 RepID=UPI001A978FFD|nr:hypothetical protein [Pontibacillus sp. ALD_SL1]QST02232.1 hypothetical protein IMZ31_22525 [Pontibacillus sp. ALD_SL1]
MAIITKVQNFDEEWDKWIDCKCTVCNTVFEESTEDLDLDAEDPLVTCPECGHEAPLTLIGPVRS